MQKLQIWHSIERRKFSPGHSHDPAQSHSHHIPETHCAIDPKHPSKLVECMLLYHSAGGSILYGQWQISFFGMWIWTVWISFLPLPLFRVVAYFVFHLYRSRSRYRSRWDPRAWRIHLNPFQTLISIIKDQPLEPSELVHRAWAAVFDNPDCYCYCSRLRWCCLDLHLQILVSSWPPVCPPAWELWGCLETWIKLRYMYVLCSMWCLSWLDVSEGCLDFISCIIYSRKATPTTIVCIDTVEGLGRGCRLS